MGGGGVAIVMKPVELHFECNYKCGITNFSDPKMYSEQVWVYTHPTQLTFNLGLFFRLGTGLKTKAKTKAKTQDKVQDKAQEKANTPKTAQ